MGIWDVEYEEYQLPDVTDQAIKNAEKKLKVKLPEAYIALMREQNGGVPLHQAFPCETPNSWAEDHVPVSSIYGIGEDGILLSGYLIKEWGLPKKLVLFSGDGNSWLAMDYRKTKSEPPIVFIDTDEEKIIEVAPDFASFLNGLYTAEAADIPDEELEEDWPIEQIDQVYSEEDEANWIHAFNALFSQTHGNEAYIENKILELLDSPSENLRKLAAHYVMVYHEHFVFTETTMQAIYVKMEKDPFLQGEVETTKQYLQQLQAYK